MRRTRKAQERSEKREWWWVNLTLAAFVFAPMLRRLLDWKGHFSSIDVISPLPVAMLVPISYWAVKNRAKLKDSAFNWVLLGWGVAFGYAALAGIIQLAGLTAIYGIGIYVLPVSIGAWVLTLSESAQNIMRRFAQTTLILAGISGIYGVIQWLVAPPWDTKWMVDINAGSFGQPAPFQIRVFGPSNSPGSFASFLAGALILSVTYLNLRRIWTVVAVAGAFVSLVLTQVRAGWLEVILGIAVLALLHPNRIRSVASILLLVIVSGVAITAFVSFAPDESVRTELVERLSTFQDLSEDGSARDRANSVDDALKAAKLNPQGVGLGVSGSAAKLTPASTSAYYFNADPAIDNGYISRLYEMGYFGFAAFMVTMILALAYCVKAYRLALSRATDREDTGVAAICVAFVVGTMGVFYGGDAIQGLIGVLFFISIAVSCRLITQFQDTPALAKQSSSRTKRGFASGRLGNTSV